MYDLPDYLPKTKEDYDPISKRYNKALEDYIVSFGNTQDLNKYISTWDYTEQDFLELAIRLENCIKLKKRYKHLYMCLIERIYQNTIGPFIRYRILKIIE